MKKQDTYLIIGLILLVFASAMQSYIPIIGLILSIIGFACMVVSLFLALKDEM